MMMSPRFLVSVVDLWSRWKFFLPAAVVLFIVLFIVLVTLQSAAFFLYIACLTAAFFGLHMAIYSGEKILLTSAQATFLRDRGSAMFRNRLSNNPPSTLADLWKVLNDMEEEQRKELEASRRSELVRIFNSIPGERQEEDSQE